MSAFEIMVQILIGVKLALPTIGVLVAKCRDNTPRWIAPRRKPPTTRQ